MAAPHHAHTGPKRLIPLWEGRAVLIGTGLVITLCAALLLMFQPLLVRQAELRIYDLMLSGRNSPPTPDLPVQVVIDEESLNAYGQWPWPRYRMARLVERLHDAGAKVVALDFLMPEPDRTSPEIIIAERRRDREPAAAISSSGDKDSNSLLLARAISMGETVLGYFFDFVGAGGSQGHGTPVVPEGMVVTKGIGSDSGFPKPVAMIRSIQVLTDATRAEGFTNATHDCDGALRRVPLLLPYEGKLYPSLGLAALLLTSDDRRLSLTQVSSETALLWGKRRIPLDNEGNLLLDYRVGESSFTYLSARSVLDGKVAPEILKGKIVLVGALAKGLGDYHLVPSGQSLSGLTIHATIIDNILSGRFISRPGWARGAELFAVLLFGVVSTWLLSRPGFLLSLLPVAVGSTLCYWGGRELLVTKGIYLSPLLPMVTPIVIMTFLSLLKYGIEARKVRQRTRDLIEAQDTIIFSMSALTATRDKETGGHIVRTRHYVEILARQLATLPAYDELDENNIELLVKSAPLHDIGKVGIPDEILHKEGKLTTMEYETMKNHTLIGADALAKTIAGLGHPESNDFLHYAQDMIESHHERWDGGGYPRGLQGEAIPLAGRLMALADVYDALTSRRVYKEGFSHEKAMEFILQGSGKQFDPDVIAAFVTRNEEFRRVATDFADETL
jgi:adenylate cyclase